MDSQDHGIPSSKGCAQERSSQSSVGFGKQEEARLEAREEKLSDSEDQALATNVGKRKGKRNFRSQKEDHSPKESKKFQKSQKNKDPSKIKCYGCQKVGHYMRDCPLLKEVKKKVNKRNHEHVAEE